MEIAESEYREQLITALRRTAAGHWGLLGANQQMEAADRTAAVELLESAKLIQDIRAKLGITDPFDLHERFIALRQANKEPNSVGEPKLAQQFLLEMDAGTI